jgi:Ion channel
LARVCLLWAGRVSPAGQESVLIAAKYLFVRRSRQRFGWLLVALGATFLFEGVSATGDVQVSIGTVLLGATLLLALNVAEVPARDISIAAVFVGLIVAGVIAATLADESATVRGLAAIANGLLIALAPPAVVIGVYRNLRESGTVTVTVVAGVLCLYLLFGLFFAAVFVAIQNLGGAPFFANGAAAVPSRSVYFSFVTIATLGYGDYTARTNLGHTLSAAEALVGQIYLVTVVAAIVGRLVRPSTVPNASAADRSGSG